MAAQLAHFPARLSSPQPHRPVLTPADDLFPIRAAGPRGDIRCMAAQLAHFPGLFGCFQGLSLSTAKPNVKGIVKWDSVPFSRARINTELLIRATPNDLPASAVFFRRAVR